MDRFFLRLIVGVVACGLGYAVHRHSSTPVVNASLDAAALDRAMVLPMGQLVWEVEPDAAFTRSKQTGKPVLMLFTAEWCGPCRSVHAGPLADARVQAGLMQHFVPLYMDVTERADTPAQQMMSSFGASSIPRLVVANASGRALSNTSGSMNSSNYLRWIKKYKP